MSNALRALYRAAILDHSRRPRNFRRLEGTQHAEAYNPLCGDRVTVHLNEADGRLHVVTFQGSGCAIAMASASMLTEAVPGRSRAEVDALQRSFAALVS